MWPFNGRKRPAVFRRVMLLQQLEPRIVLDAAVADQHDQTDSVDHAAHVDIAGQGVTPGPAQPVVQAPPEAAPSPQGTDSPPLNVILVSNAVADVAAITHAAKDNAQVIVFDHAQDNLSTVVAKLDNLAQSSGHQIGTIAIVDHGGAGYFDVGSDQINVHNLWAYEAKFQSLRHDLASGAQIQFYACDTAENALGTDLVNSIALYTGANVFASVDDTGGAHGNWTLEYSSSTSVSFHSIIDSGTLNSQQADLGGNPGEPRNTWFHGSGTFAGWDIYNYDAGVYYTTNYTTFWNHLDAGSWQYDNTAAWVTTDGLGDAPYGDGAHYGAVGTWFTAPSGVGDYSGHNVYIGVGVTYYQDDLGCSPVQYWAHYDSSGSWQHYDGSAWRSVTDFEAYPQNVWFHYGLGGYDGFDYSGGFYYTTNYTTFWNHLDAGSWQYDNTAAWVTTDGLGDAPYGDGAHYGAVGTWFTAPSGVGDYSGHNVYIGVGVTYYQDDLGCSPVQYWAHYDSSGSWQHYDGSAWRSVTDFEAYPQNVWFHYGLGGYDAFDYSGGFYYTTNYATYWNHLDADHSWQYYNTAAWVTTDGLGDAPYGDGAHYGPVGTWFTAPSSGVGPYSNYDVYIGVGVTYYSENSHAAEPTDWAHYDASGAWSYYDTSAWYSTTGFLVEPQHVWFHGYGDDAGWDVYNCTANGPSFYTHDHVQFWEQVNSSGQWYYYDGAVWMVEVGLGSTFIPDGEWHTWNSDWAYEFTGTVVYWKDTALNNLIVFEYDVAHGQWYDEGNSGGWQTLGPNGMSVSFMGDGNPHTLDTAWTYQFSSGVGTWTDASVSAALPVFEYYYATGQWQDQGPIGGFQLLGPSGLSASFMGDGNPHTLDTTWTYQFSSGVGTWTDASVSAALPVFEYYYATGQWQDQGSFGGLYDLGPSGLSASFMGDGDPHTLDTTWTYQFSSGVGTWTDASVSAALPVFEYDYATGQWQDQGPTGGFQLLGPSGLSASFMGDGNPHTLDTTWTYQFSSGVGTWTDPRVIATLPVFEYDYATGQWQHQGRTGGFQLLGPSGLSSSFMGDGNPHTLDTTWTYQFISEVVGRWTDANVSATLPIFQYFYATGQWTDQGPTGGFFGLGFSGQSSSFMGDGNVHTLVGLVSGTWYYKYGGGVGYWAQNSDDLLYGVPTAAMFDYDYATGQWQDQGTTGGFQLLGPSGLSASFMGAGNHTLDSTWTYKFINGVGTWTDPSVSATLPVFEYDYATGQWQDQGLTGGLQLLGSSGMSASFVGDSHMHTLYLTSSTWSYYYLGGVGYWQSVYFVGSDHYQLEFRYVYSTGAWQSHGQGNYDWGDLGPSGGLSASFVADGDVHTLGALPSGTWYYKYSGGVSYWAENATSLNNPDTGARFEYVYSTGTWQSQGSSGGWGSLGPSGLSAAFVADGNVHTLEGMASGTWYYKYSGGVSYWAENATSLDNPDTGARFEYVYSNSTSQSHGSYGGWAVLGLSGASATFMGDGEIHDLGALDSGTWYYVYSGGVGYWGWNATSLSNPDAGARFEYVYSTGTWNSQGPTGGWGNLGPSGIHLSPSFVGDGHGHTLDSRWSFSFDFNADTGTRIGTWDDRLWDSPAGCDLFEYDYNGGVWFIDGFFNAGMIMGARDHLVPASFIGDGDLHYILPDDGHSHRKSISFTLMYYPGTYNVIGLVQDELNVADIKVAYYDFYTGQWYDRYHQPIGGDEQPSWPPPW